mgnify:CR=1 FL=1
MRGARLAVAEFETEEDANRAEQSARAARRPYKFLKASPYASARTTAPDQSTTTTTTTTTGRGHVRSPSSTTQDRNSESLSSTHIFVGPLTRGVSKGLLMLYFRRFGHVVEVRLAPLSIPGQPRGFGVVTFETVEAANNALTFSDSHLIAEGCRIECQRVAPGSAAVNSEIPPPTESTPATRNSQQDGWGSKVQSKGHWACAACTFHNEDAVRAFQTFYFYWSVLCRLVVLSFDSLSQ